MVIAVAPSVPTSSIWFDSYIVQVLAWKPLRIEECPFRFILLFVGGVGVEPAARWPLVNGHPLLKGVRQKAIATPVLMLEAGLVGRMGVVSQAHQHLPNWWLAHGGESYEG